eukprot:scaffold36079_cov65-Cyclotella_meneghiniana.AAC.4
MEYKPTSSSTSTDARHVHDPVGCRAVGLWTLTIQDTTHRLNDAKQRQSFANIQHNQLNHRLIKHSAYPAFSSMGLRAILLDCLNAIITTSREQANVMLVANWCNLVLQSLHSWDAVCQVAVGFVCIPHLMHLGLTPSPCMFMPMHPGTGQY